ncbi:MAG: hypothetical protein GF398_15435 [Chitinivibrionales bacterium]|nr:hypothetical protein [Chitinivibrionales bacterium]
MNETKSDTLVEELIGSYEQQLDWYRELNQMVQKALSTMVLSRGDISSLLTVLQRKQRLMEQITAERDSITSQIAFWQEHKATIPNSDRTAYLNSLLEKTARLIESFLDNETQIQKHLEHLMNSSQVKR